MQTTLVLTGSGRDEENVSRKSLWKETGGSPFVPAAEELITVHEITGSSTNPHENLGFTPHQPAHLASDVAMQEINVLLAVLFRATIPHNNNEQCRTPASMLINPTIAGAVLESGS